MQTKAVPAILATLVMGIFGAFLRWLQIMNIFEEETGLSKPHALSTRMLVLYSIAAVLVMAGKILLWLRRYRRPENPEELLPVPGPMPAVFCWVLFAVLAAAGVMQMFSAGEARYPMLQRLLGTGTVVAGACLPFLLGRVTGGVSPVSRTASLYLPAFFAFWLVYTYLCSFDNPVLWDYVPEILAISANAVAACHIAGCIWGRRLWNRTAVWVQIAAYCSICVMADSRRAAFQAIFAVMAALLLLAEYLMICDLREPEDAPVRPARRQTRRYF